MKQQEVFKRIGIIIKELNQQYDYLSANEGQLNDLELELFVANAHFLADHSEVLSKLNLLNTPPPPIEKPKTTYEETHFEPLVQQLKPATPDKPTPVNEANTDESSGHSINLQGDGDDTGDSFSFIRQEPEIIKHELILDESEAWDEDDEGFINEELTEEEEPAEQTPAAPEVEPVVNKPAALPTTVEPATAIIPEPAKDEPEHVPYKPIVHSVSTHQTEEPLTVNQKISAQLHPVNRVTEHLNTQTISDLKQAITLNDKLLYVKDLFNGYSLAYSEVIDILNRFTTFDEADKFLQANYATKNNWESKQATVDKFYALLQRRYL